MLSYWLIIRVVWENEGIGWDGVERSRIPATNNKYKTARIQASI
jgi:hypothetical protein